MSTSTQRLVQGVRRSPIRTASTQSPAATGTEIALLEVFSPHISAEYIALSIRDSSFIALAGTSDAFRKEWKLSKLSVDGSENLEIFDLPSFSDTGLAVSIAGLTHHTAQYTRSQYLPGYISVYLEEAIVYTAVFIRRTEEPSSPSTPPKTSLSCLSLTNDNDLAFVFPFDGAASPRVLWANKSKLAQKSTYFGSIISSGFEESGQSLAEISKMLAALQQDLGKVAARERATGARGPSLAEHSDEEEVCTGDNQEETSGEKDGKGSISYVVIRDTPYKTYRALFQWFETHEIGFAALKSASTSNKSTLQASPKSVYRLCHQLGIDDLKALALANFETQLSSKNVLQELFSTNSFHYPELRAAALRVLEKNWAAVKANGDLDALLEVVNKGGSDAEEMMRVAIDILKRL